MLAVLRRRSVWLICWLPLLTGCAAFHPLDGVPANLLPQDLRGETRSGKRTINLSLLRQTPSDEYRLDSGDVLGVYIAGVLGSPNQVPPVFYPQQGDTTPPSIGYPIAVRDDGRIALPLARPISVRGMTVSEAEQEIHKAVKHETRLLNSDNPAILVSLQKKRTVNVLVIRQEQGITAATSGGQGLQLGSIKRGTGRTVTLTAYKNDVLHALTETGGLPGLDAENTIYVIRRKPRPPYAPPLNWPAAVPAEPVPAGAPLQLPPPLAPEQPLPGVQLPGPQSLRTDAPAQRINYELIAPRNGGQESPSWGHSAPLDIPGTMGPNGVGNQSDARDLSAPPPTQAAMTMFRGQSPYEQRPDVYAYPGGDPQPQSGDPQQNQGYYDPRYAPPAAGYSQPQPQVDWPAMADGPIDDPNSFLEARRRDCDIITIPVRLFPGEVPQFTERDIILNDGDVVFIESRETEVFYTGGLIGGSQHSLPRDYDLTVLGAIAIATGGNLGGGGGGTIGSGVGGLSALNRDISVSASDVIILRTFPDGSNTRIKVDLNKALREPQKYNILIQPGDYVLLQYKPHEAIAAFVERNLLAGGLIGLAATQVTGTGGNGGSN